MYCPCISAVVADRPLSPATRHRLGRLLPHQLADRTQAPPETYSYVLYSYETMENYPIFRWAMLHFEVDSYALLTRLPVILRPPWLACLRHAASVHPEPGSNSQKNFDAVKIFAVRYRMVSGKKMTNIKNSTQGRDSYHFLTEELCFFSNMLLQ